MPQMYSSVWYNFTLTPNYYSVRARSTGIGSNAPLEYMEQTAPYSVLF